MKEMILYHIVCLVGLAFVWVRGNDEKKNKKKTVLLQAVYVMIAFLAASDCTWGILSASGCTNVPLLYAVNIVYYLSAMLGVYFWFIYAITELKSNIYANKMILMLISLPAAAMCVLTLLAPCTGLLFTVGDDGTYMRGKLFFLDSAVKLVYLLFSCILGFVCAGKAKRKFEKKRDTFLAIYSVPVIIAGILQVLTGMDFNCIGPVVGLVILFRFGISNEARNKSDIMMALAKSYKLAYLVDIDDHTVRTIYTDPAFGEDPVKLSGSNIFEECTMSALRRNIVPEDRLLVEKSFRIDNVLKHLEKNSSYSVIYKTTANNGQLYNKATFMKAFSKEERHELFVGIEAIETRQLLLQEKEDLEDEKERFERVKESFANVIANVIEARDVESGEHVMRVKSYTQYICNQVMEDYPDFGLTPLKVRYITSASALHDVGKIMIPDAILLKPGKLTPEEFEIMKTHSEKGCQILDRLPDDLDPEYIRYAKEICRSHHERYDGRGYPDKLKGNKIPISAQIVAIADCFDALTTKRVYKDAVPKEEAFRMILEGKCGVFSPEMLDSFQKVYKELTSGRF